MEFQLILWSGTLPSLRDLAQKLITHKKTQTAGVGAGYSAVKSFTKLPVMNKKIVLPMDDVIAFEKAIFSDMDNLRFVKVPITLKSLVPTSVAIDVTLDLIYFMDMICDINNELPIEKLMDMALELGDSAAKSLLFSTESKGTLELTLFVSPDDVIWPKFTQLDIPWSVLSTSRYYVSAELINRHSTKNYMDGNNYIIEY